MFLAFNFHLLEIESKYVAVAYCYKLFLYSECSLCKKRSYLYTMLSELTSALLPASVLCYLCSSFIPYTTTVAEECCNT